MNQETTDNLFVLLVPRLSNGRRFDVVATELLRTKTDWGKALTRGEVIRLIRSGAIRLNERSGKPSQVVGYRDRIMTVPAACISPDVPLVRPEPALQLDILAESERFLILNKPAGILVHPAGRHLTGSLSGALLAHCPDMAGVGEHPLRPGIVHRLDRETSGAMIVAKTQEAYGELKKLFQSRSVQKAYIAFVMGHLPKTVGSIDRPLARRSGSLKRRVLASDSPSVPSSRFAYTEYRVLARSPRYDAVLAYPRTGRTHQIRAHLAALGHPIVGDRLYANKATRSTESAGCSRQMLHASRLAFRLDGQSFTFIAPLPEDMRFVWRMSGPWKPCPVDENEMKGYDAKALEELFSD